LLTSIQHQTRVEQQCCSLRLLLRLSLCLLLTWLFTAAGLLPINTP
jgi:hypothetical protein